MLQRHGYHGDELQRGFSVCPIYTRFQAVSMEEPPGCRSVTAGLSMLHTSSYLPLDSDVLVDVIFVFKPTSLITLDMQHILK